MGEPVIVTTPSELRALIRDAVAAELRAARPAEPPSAYLDLHEVAALLEVHPRTIRNYIRREGFPVHRIGTRTLRFSRADVETWLVERAARPGGRATATRGTLVRLHGLEPKGR
jgi:excisionase family DNA binding protein